MRIISCFSNKQYIFLTLVFSNWMSELYPQFDIISEYQIFTYETIQNLQKEILSNYSEKNLMQTSESKEQVHTFFWILALSEESGK